jgi:hypothetical protein
MNQQERETAQLEYPTNPNILKFEIIETYIAQNAFTTKKAWEKGIAEELRQVEALGAFPEGILDAFRKASAEIRKELTLSNIREIKKIIADNT